METKLPARISRIDELANNLWWSWHEEARNLFRALDYPLWRMTIHNPVKQLREISPDILKKAAGDPEFLALYDEVMSQFDADMLSVNDWFAREHSGSLPGSVAFFSMEYAIHNSLPIYAGGLGVLAGDICKEASDIGLPLVAIGFMYPQGYFHQHISAEGWQEELYRQLDFAEAPINRISISQDENDAIKVHLGDMNIAIGVWRVQVGKTDIYLLDTNLAENPPQYRDISARLYVSDRERRLQQEIVLGIGGVRVLRALNVLPAIWHANEGHTAFMMLERIRELVATGLSFEEAKKRVQAKTVFTTHTPVMAGHDIFATQLMEKYFRSYIEGLGINLETFLQLGQQDNYQRQNFNMTVFALRMSEQRTSVSQLHGKVTRRMWQSLWPSVSEDDVPISSVTNGVHIPSWIAPELCHVFEQYMGKNCIRNYSESELWERIPDIPDEDLWAAHQLLKRKLIGAMREGARNRWVKDDLAAKQVGFTGVLLNPDILTIGFVRRFTEYKRPTLIFQDIARLKNIIRNDWHPVQIIFAGKSHPADSSSKQLIHEVYSLATDHDFRGRVAFIEDYDMHMARYLVQGVDVWLNTPRRLQEACGTSGMKASANGVMHLSVRDGWWQEGYQGNNGWAIGPVLNNPRPDEEDAADAESLYHLLEEEIVPLYYSRDCEGVPCGWVKMMKEAIRSVVLTFSARRMLKEYTERIYLKTVDAK